MHRTEIEAYFTRRQREVLVIQCLEPWHYHIIHPKIKEIDESPSAGAFILRHRGWTTAAIARAYQVSWHVADRLVKDGHKKIEEELNISISTTKEGNK